MNACIGHFIDGKPFTESNTRSGSVYNPSTGEEIAQCAYASRDTVEKAVSTAKSSAQQWGASSHAKRLAVMFKFRELVIANMNSLAEIIGREHGKTIPDALGEIGRGIEAIEFACNEPHITKGEYSNNVAGDIDVFSVRRPIGVVGCITPFNFPVMVPMVMFTMAVAVGNTVVWKPSEKVPSAALEIARLWKKAGLPDGVFNVVQGDKEVVDAILEHPDIAGVSFVGSTAVGEYVYQKGTSNNKRVAAFTGGKNHMVVLPDADLEAAATAFVTAGYGSASQRCMAVSLLLPVGHETAERLLELIVPKIKALKVGPYDDPNADYGALISSDAKNAVEGAIERCKEEGAQLVLDGRRLEVPNHPHGYYLGPSLVDNVTTDMQIYKDEVFGPVRGIIRVETFEEALTVTNKHDYGNGSVIYTRDGKSAHRFMMEVESGMIGVNVPVPLPTSYFNFGGLRESKFGDGHLYGPDAARFYTIYKTVSQRWPESDNNTFSSSLAFNPSA